MKVSNEMKMLLLTDIFMSKTNPRGLIKDGSLSELVQSIKDKGVIQPILVRPKGVTFELVCGERRLRSAVLAGLKEIPANIRKLTDDEAYELQIIENLEREDLHPMEEALSFKKLLDKDLTIADIAGKVARKETFIAQRLSLLNLIAPLQKDFRKNLLGIGHAVLLSRYNKAIQKGVYEDCATGWNNSKKDPQYGTLKVMKDKLEKVLPLLKKAPFDLESIDLFKKAGACTVCPKRTLANPLLFEDEQSDDKCLDKTCYNKKIDAHVLKTVNDMIEHNIDGFICTSDDDPDDKIQKICDDHKVKILKAYQDFKTHEPWDKHLFKKVKGFYIDGSNKGNVENIWIKKSVEKKVSVKPESREAKSLEAVESIAKIESRAVRSLELDGEKVWKKIREINDKSKFLLDESPLTQVEKNALRIALKDDTYSDPRTKFTRDLDAKNILTRKVSDAELNQAIRRFINMQLTESFMSHLNDEGHSIYKACLEQHYLEDIKAFEKEQQEIADKRIARKNERVDKLKKAIIKEKPVKAEIKKKAPVKKKGTVKPKDKSKSNGTVSKIDTEVIVQTKPKLDKVEQS